MPSRGLCEEGGSILAWDEEGSGGLGLFECGEGFFVFNNTGDGDVIGNIAEVAWGNNLGRRNGRCEGVGSSSLCAPVEPVPGIILAGFCLLTCVSSH